MLAGVSLIDMEMISFCPTVMCYPDIFSGNILTYILISLGFANLLNKTGKPFTYKYMSREVEVLALNTEWNKMLLSYAIQSEINAGNSTMHGGVYCDLPRQPDAIDELYNILPGLKSGIYKDIMKLIDNGRAFIVSPAAHYFEGGIEIGEDMATGVEGLYAAGECTGGLFGANRVNAGTTEMLIEGVVAGENAASFAKQAGICPAVSAAEAETEKVMMPFKRKNGVAPRELVKRMKEALSKSLYVLRNEEDMEEALNVANGLQAELKDVAFTKKSYVYNREFMDYIMLRNGIVTARAILTSALARKESRGVHIRTDYFHTDNNNQHCNYRITDNDMKVESLAVKNSMAVDEGVYDYAGYIETVVSRLS